MAFRVFLRRLPALPALPAILALSERSVAAAVQRREVKGSDAIARDECNAHHETCKVQGTWYKTWVQGHGEICIMRPAKYRVWNAWWIESPRLEKRKGGEEGR